MFCLEDNKNTSVFFFITKILWWTFLRNNWQSVFDVVNYCTVDLLKHIVHRKCMSWGDLGGFLRVGIFYSIITWLQEGSICQRGGKERKISIEGFTELCRTFFYSCIKKRLFFHCQLNFLLIPIPSNNAKDLCFFRCISHWHKTKNQIWGRRSLCLHYCCCLNSKR